MISPSFIRDDYPCWLPLHGSSVAGKSWWMFHDQFPSFLVEFPMKSSKYRGISTKATAFSTPIPSHWFIAFPILWVITIPSKLARISLYHNHHSTRVL